MQLPPANWFAPPDGNRSRLFLGDEKHSFLGDFPCEQQGSGEGTNSFEGG